MDCASVVIRTRTIFSPSGSRCSTLVVRLRGKMTHSNPSNDDFVAWRLVLWYTGLSASARGASDSPRLVGDGEGEGARNRQILDGMRKRPGGRICGQHGKLGAYDRIYAKRHAAALVKLAVLNNG